MLRFSYLGYRRLFGVITEEEEEEREQLTERQTILDGLQRLAELDREDASLRAYEDVAYLDASVLLGGTAFTAGAAKLGINLTLLRPAAALNALRAGRTRLDDMIKMRRREVDALVASRFADLEAQGHGPQRHEGAVTRQMLEDRVLIGFDPMTGSRTDGVTGVIRPLNRRATRITSEVDFVTADAFVHRSLEFRSSIDAVFSLVGRGRPRFESVLPIEDVLGPNYAGAVEGVRRLGSFNNPQGIVPIGFNGGQVKAVYELTPDGGAVLVTLFPIGGT